MTAGTPRPAAQALASAPGSLGGPGGRDGAGTGGS